jgi:branched-subunit amino acid ABC-type transport system permease component
MANILQLVWFGAVLGSILALGALGLTLIFGILNFINLAYGEYMAIGAFITLTLVGTLPLPAAALVGVVAGALLALVTDKIFFTHFSDRGPVIMLVVSIGVGFILRNAIRAIFGTGAKYFPGGTSANFRFLGINVLYYQILIVVVSVVLVVAVYVLLQRTKIGIGMRAMSDDGSLAQVRGLNTGLLTNSVWLIGGGIAGVAGIMLGLDSQLTPGMGFGLLVPIFAAVFIGGIGDPVGAVIGGYALGIAMKVSTLVIPSHYQHAVALAVLITALLVEPEGVFGEAAR